jgi:hypothetical protein
MDNKTPQVIVVLILAALFGHAERTEQFPSWRSKAEFTRADGNFRF